MSLQLDTEATIIKAGRDSIPAARTNGNNISFTQLLQSLTDDVVSTQRERHLWKLTAILFDPVEKSCEEFSQGVPAADADRLEKQIRRQAVLDFWRGLTHDSATKTFRDAETLEEKAFASLCWGDIEGACTTLIEGRNFHLATLVAQLQSSEHSKEVMRKQLGAWRAQKATSEMPIAVRAIYELVAGNATISEGTSGSSEDRAPTFSLSEHFELDWQQAVGLRLWYGSDDIGLAVSSYLDDITGGKESVKPIPAAFSNEKVNGDSNVQDGLLALLRLYAARSQGASFDARDLLSPVALTGNHFDTRLAWQLATLLSAKGILPTPVSGADADSLTNSLAAQLESQSTASSILTASTVLLHLSSPALRIRAIQSLLSRRAALLTPSAHPFAIDPSRDTSLQYLLKTQIPAAWLHSARALYAAAIGDRYAQAAHLLLAGAKEEAHNVLCAHVGPAAVVSRDFDALRELLGHFLPSLSSSSTAAPPGIPTWSSGGQIYFDYVHLLDLAGPRADERQKAKVLARLAAALPNVPLPPRAVPPTDNSNPSGRIMGTPQGLEQRVAVAEMSRVVLAESQSLASSNVGASPGGPLGAKRLSKLPIPDEGYVRQGTKLWDLYGKALLVQ